MTEERDYEYDKYIIIMIINIIVIYWLQDSYWPSYSE